MAGNGQIKLDTDKIKKDIEDMAALKTSIINYTPQLSFENSKGLSVEKMMTVYKVYQSMQAQLAGLYINTELALMMTDATFSEADNFLGNYFAALGCDEDD